MITTPTVFVLGAGCSMPYGFPSGPGLKKRILNMTASTDINVLRLLPEACTKFQEALAYSKVASVDRFLETQDNAVRTIGKRFIASALIRHEVPQNIFLNPNDESNWDDWYEYLFDTIMALKPKQVASHFADNQLSFITFNYDRSLEFAMYNHLFHTYNLSRDECLDMMRQTPIVHVHGELGPFSPDGINGRQYNFDIGDIEYVANSIRIVSDDIDEDERFKLAHKLIYDADRTFFLGYGYLEENIRRLKLDEYCSADVFCSTYGRTQSENDRTRKSIRTGTSRHVYFAKSNEWQTTEYLRNNIDIIMQ